jgi:hypothetical protein
MTDLHSTKSMTHVREGRDTIEDWLSQRGSQNLHYLALRVVQLMRAGGDGRVGNQPCVYDSVTGLICVHVSLFTYSRSV